MRYHFFFHTAHPRFRLVLREGDPFPSETTSKLWTHSRVREEADVAEQVRAEIATRGYSLFKLGVGFDEIPLEE